MLNHTLLTLEVLASAHIRVDALVVNATADCDLPTGSNADCLRRVRPDQRLLEVPRVAHWTEAAPHLSPLVEILRP